MKIKQKSRNIIFDEYKNSFNEELKHKLPYKYDIRTNNESINNNNNNNNNANVLNLYDKNPVVYQIDEYLNNIKPVNSKIPGTSITLLPHQTIGVAKMIYIESTDYNGGLLADDMGLGKTIQLLSLIKLEYDDCINVNMTHQKTIIIAPLCTLYQWNEEIENKLHKSNLKHLLYYGKNRKNCRFADLQKYQIILTNYNTILTEYKKFKENNQFTIFNVLFAEFICI